MLFSFLKKQFFWAPCINCLLFNMAVTSQCSCLSLMSSVWLKDFFYLAPNVWKFSFYLKDARAVFGISCRTLVEVRLGWKEKVTSLTWRLHIMMEHAPNAISSLVCDTIRPCLVVTVFSSVHHLILTQLFISLSQWLLKVPGLKAIYPSQNYEWG